MSGVSVLPLPMKVRMVGTWAERLNESRRMARNEKRKSITKLAQIDGKSAKKGFFVKLRHYMDLSVTVLVRQAQAGDLMAEDLLYQKVYDKMRGIARAMLGRERAGHSLEATALVAEAFLQKLRKLRIRVESRDHFYSLTAMAMKQVLMDHARRKAAQKRQSAGEMAMLLVQRRPEMELAISRALKQLDQLDHFAHEAVCLRYINGFGMREIAGRMGRAEWRVRLDCQFGLKWLGAQLAELS